MSYGLVVILLTCTIASAGDSTRVFCPSPYLSTADIPAGFYDAGGFIALENFEDASLDFGILTSSISLFNDACSILFPGGGWDSVDADDGVIDGSGSMGDSWFSGATTTFTFDKAYTAVGIVVTDFNGDYALEAYGPGMVLLASVDLVGFGDGKFTGQTAEDRFIGFTDPIGIIALRLVGPTREIDHLQFGNMNPAFGCNAADLAEPFEQLDFSDVIAFLLAFGTGANISDLTLPFCQFDFSDVVAFLTAFGAGCP